MPIWLTTVLALGGSTLISLIVTSIWRKGEAKVKKIKELEQKAADDKRYAEECERQEKWERRVESLIAPIDKKIDDLRDDIKKNTEGTISSLRADMMLMRDRFRDQGFASHNDKAAWFQLYNDYRDLGGNHFREYVDQWKEEIEKLPVSVDASHDRRRNNN